MQPSIAGSEVSHSQRPWLAVDPGDLTASLFDQQATGCPIPRVQIHLPVGIQLPSRQIGQVQYRGTRPADSLDTGHDRVELGQVVAQNLTVRGVAQRSAPVGKAGRYQRLTQLPGI